MRFSIQIFGKQSGDILMKLHLELADLGVKGEGVKEHGADEGDVGRLAGQSKVSCGKLFWMDFNWGDFMSVFWILPK